MLQPRNIGVDLFDLAGQRFERVLLFERQLAFLRIRHRCRSARHRAGAIALCIRGLLGRGQIRASALGDHVAIAAGVLGPAALAFGRDDAGDDAVEKVAVMTDEQYRPRVIVQQLLQQIERFEVEVVGRLVEHENVRRLGQHAGEQQSRTLATRQHADRATRLFGLE